MQRSIRNPHTLLLVAVLALGVAGTLVLTSGMTFYQDTWAFLMDRRDPSADTLFRPHNEHLVVFPVAIEMLLLRVFGMSSALPEYVLLALFLAATAALLYAYLERRVGPWPSLFAVLVVLTLGPAWEALLWPFEITFIGPIMFGLAMLLALEREDRWGDVAACAFLVLALGFSGLGICFIAAAAVAILLGPREAWLRRSYVFAVPLFLYGLWWLGWGRDVESHVSLGNLADSPVFVADSIAWALQSLLGLGPTLSEGPDAFWGRLLLLATALGLLAVAALAIRARPGRPAWLRVDRGLWPVLAAAFANWLLTALNAIPGRDPSSSRYQYAGAIFVLMIAANLLKGVRLGNRALVAIGAVTALVVWSNLDALEQGRESLDAQTVLTRSDTAGLEIAARTVPPELQLVEPLTGTPSLIDIVAYEYLEAAGEYGSPAYTPAELATAPAAGRRQADIFLSQALPLRADLWLERFRARRGAGCVAVPGGDPASGVPLAPGPTRVEVAAGPPAELRLRRFAAGEFPVEVRDAPGRSTVVLRIPRDRSDRPWRLRVEAEQPVRVCGDG
jgi:hypothetical protein